MESNEPIGADRGSPDRGSAEGKVPRDLVAGLFAIAVATLGLWGTLELAFRTPAGIGPGMMPRTTALLLAALGALLVVNSLLARSDVIERGALRGVVFILGAALLFAWLIRPMGLVVAGPVAIIFSSFADADSRLREIIPFAIVMTAVSIVLFSWGLNLPIPVWPTATPAVPFLPTIRF